MAIKSKKPSINYTNRDFNSIRNDLLEYAKRYYPDTYKDFNEWISRYNNWVANEYTKSTKDTDEKLVNEFVDIEAA